MTDYSMDTMGADMDFTADASTSVQSAPAAGGATVYEYSHYQSTATYSHYAPAVDEKPTPSHSHQEQAASEKSTPKTSSSSGVKASTTTPAKPPTPTPSRSTSTRYDSHSRDRRVPNIVKRVRQPSGHSRSSRSSSTATNSIADGVAIALADIKASSPLAKVVRPGSIPEAAMKKSFTRGPGPVALPPGKNAVQVRRG